MARGSLAGQPGNGPSSGGAGPLLALSARYGLVEARDGDESLKTRPERRVFQTRHAKSVHRFASHATRCSQPLCIYNCSCATAHAVKRPVTTAFCKARAMSALAAAAPDLPLTLFDDDSTASSLTKLRAGKPLIIDFWTTLAKAVPCLDKLDKIAESLGDKVVFAALCLDDPDFAQELVDEHDWDHIRDGGMDLETKEKAKAAFGFNSVPHLVIIGADGTTLFCGSALKATAAGIDEGTLGARRTRPSPCGGGGAVLHDGRPPGSHCNLLWLALFVDKTRLAAVSISKLKLGCDACGWLNHAVPLALHAAGRSLSTRTHRERIAANEQAAQRCMHAWLLS